MIDWNTAQQLVQEQASTFPAEFGLRAFPGDRFRISLRSSYVNDSGVVMLYTQRYCPGFRDEQGAVRWLDFAKGTAAELRREMVITREAVL